MIVVVFICVWLTSSWYDEWLCRLNTTFWFRRYGTTFIYVLKIHTSKIYPITDNKSNK